MPLFEYTCRVCSRPFEFLQISTTEEQVTCPHCGSTEVTKLPTAGSFRVGSHGSPAAGNCAGRSGFS
ncbi:MAG: zinc ribbon domain-containing protein [Desulfobulbus sp.]|jgi:putative FmdB family regulatory protein|nr:zinc ribbon domain-containing protein [Desulfobulbus sp.]